MSKKFLFVASMFQILSINYNLTVLNRAHNQLTAHKNLGIHLDILKNKITNKKEFILQT